ncbi:hypothetical protein HNP47_002119 [Brevundimonas vesicularis]|uniref:DUF4258 domain-containing protein n=1 Tax=Brevundimonas vesicularis TaxID=41276 RepID=A0A7W9FV29_BREVE|nr:hypothetical protein [Brevundimonas vesicularis]MBB5772115.1 hypothetical protein [Brevundimonas vesicularis]
MVLQMTTHAVTRASQRGVPHNLIADLLAHADLETSVGGGCVALSVSRRRLADRDLRRTVGRNIDRLRNLTVVCDAGDGSIVTILHQEGARGRRYHRA